MGCGMRSDVTKWERWPYSIRSLVPLIIGVSDAAISITWSCSGGLDTGVWPDAGVWASAARPPATAAPPVRRSLRLVRFEPINLPLEKDTTTKSRFRERKYREPCHSWQSGCCLLANCGRAGGATNSVRNTAEKWSG